MLIYGISQCINTIVWCPDRLVFSSSKLFHFLLFFDFPQAEILQGVVKNNRGDKIKYKMPIVEYILYENDKLRFFLLLRWWLLPQKLKTKAKRKKIEFEINKNWCLLRGWQSRVEGNRHMWVDIRVIVFRVALSSNRVSWCDEMLAH